MSATATSERVALSRSSSLPTFFDNLDSFAEVPKGVTKLRELILDLAVRGKLVEQDEKDEPAESILEATGKLFSQFVAEKKLKRPQLLPPIEPIDYPFVLPDGWAWCRFGQILRISSGDALTSRNMNDEGGIPVYGGNGVAGFHDKYNVEKPTLVIGRVGFYCGSIHVTPAKAWVTDNAFITTFHEDHIDLDFLSWLLRGTDLRQRDNATAQPVISGRKVFPVILALPPLSEQRRIVSKVDGLMSLCDELESRGTERKRMRLRASRSCLERLVSSRSRRDLASAWQRLSDHFEVLYDTPATLPHLRRSILQLAVQGKLVPQDPCDEPASVVLDRIEQEKSRLAKAGEIPKPRSTEPVNGEAHFEVQRGWKWTRLGDISLYIEAGWSPRCESHPRKHDEWGVLKISAVTWDVFNPNENKALPAGVAPREKCEVKPGDFVMSRANIAELVAKSVVIDETPPRLMLNDKLLRVVFSDEVDKRYINLFNNCLVARAYYESVASGTSVSMRNVSRANVENLAIPLPPLAEQKRIVAKVDQLLSQCDELNMRLRDRQFGTQQLLTATIHAILDTADNAGPHVGT